MNIADIPLFSMLRSRLGYMSERQRVVAQNIANADTPGFSPKDLKSFSFRMGEQTKGVTMVQPSQTSAGHLPGRPTAAPSAFKAVEAADSETTLDGNSVVLEDQMLKMTESRMQYDAAIGFYQKSLGLLRMAARPPGR